MIHRGLAKLWLGLWGLLVCGTLGCGEREPRIYPESLDTAESEFALAGRPCPGFEQSPNLTALTNELRTRMGLAPILCLPEGVEPPKERRRFRSLEFAWTANDLATQTPQTQLKELLADVDRRSTILSPRLRYLTVHPDRLSATVFVGESDDPEPQPVVFPDATFDGWIPLQYPFTLHFPRQADAAGFEEAVQLQWGTVHAVGAAGFGQRVPLSVVGTGYRAETGGSVAVIPKEPLLPGQRYLIRIQATYRGQPFEKRWSVVTRAGVLVDPFETSIPADQRSSKLPVSGVPFAL